MRSLLHSYAWVMGNVRSTAFYRPRSLPPSLGDGVSHRPALGTPSTPPQCADHIGRSLLTKHVWYFTVVLYIRASCLFCCGPTEVTVWLKPRPAQLDSTMLTIQHYFVLDFSCLITYTVELGGHHYVYFSTRLQFHIWLSTARFSLLCSVRCGLFTCVCHWHIFVYHCYYSRNFSFKNRHFWSFFLLWECFFTLRLMTWITFLFFFVIMERWCHCPKHGLHISSKT